MNRHIEEKDILPPSAPAAPAPNATDDLDPTYEFLKSLLSNI